VEARGVEVDSTTQASGNALASDGKRAHGTVDDAIRFLRELRQLRSEAGLESAELAARVHYPHDVIVATEAGPDLPELPVLSAYVRGCGGGLAEWEERWRSVTGSPATSLHLPARPAGCSSLAEAGAQAAYASLAVDPEDQRRILAAITRAGAAEATIPAQQSPARTPARTLGSGGAGEWAAQKTAASGAAASASAVPAAAAAADSEPAPASAAGAGPAPVPPSPPAAPVPRRTVGAGRASLPYGAGIAAMVAAIMCIIGMILLLLR
jgi:DNA-binding XRE family transcriptional regulator